ncbi:gamma-glutamyl-gamma-aminobutyrate hydrolase family protein [Crossiella sp. CA198]|uniref:gamma-glutamyl-gamma-aminobutyrate hydrolase family protein n=1 Tax=Crossiella sp. CA198 TaxID=3455607 RepID=UPI003F8CFFAF
MNRPRVIIPARFAARASALRYAALVTARALSAAVLRAGAEPLAVHPDSPDDLEQRFGFADGVLLPGGGDLDPGCYGQRVVSDTVYDVDAEQDLFDLALAEWALASGRPLFAVCRGLHVVNVALGGTLEQDMGPGAHRNLVHGITTCEGPMTVSCFHHQRIATLGRGLSPIAFAKDRTIEAVRAVSARGWFLGVQWHPEDTAHTDPAQQRLFAEFAAACQTRSASTLPPSQVAPSWL